MPPPRVCLVTGRRAQRGAVLRELFADEPIRLVCCYCDPPHVLRPGRLPASHGICPVADRRLHAELDAEEARRAAR